LEPGGVGDKDASKAGSSQPDVPRRDVGCIVLNAHTTASVREVSLLPVLVYGTPSEKFSSNLQQDVNYTHFKQALKRHILGGS